MEIKLSGIPTRGWYAEYPNSNLLCVISSIDAGYRLSWANGCWHGAQHEVATWEAVEHACRAYPIIDALSKKRKHCASNMPECGNDALVIEWFAPFVAVYSYANGKYAAWEGHVQAFENMDDLRQFNRQVIDGTVQQPLVHAEQLAFVRKLCDL